MDVSLCRVLSSTARPSDFDVLQYSAVLAGILPLPSPPQPNTRPSSSKANVWSRPQLIEAIKWPSERRPSMAGRAMLLLLHRNARNDPNTGSFGDPDVADHGRANSKTCCVSMIGCGA